MPNATIIGRIAIIDGDAIVDCDVTNIDMAIVIEFENAEQIREALRTGRCEFNVLGRPAAP